MDDIKITGWRQKIDSQRLTYTDLQFGMIGAGPLSFMEVTDWMFRNEEKIRTLKPFECLHIPGRTHNWIKLECGEKKIEVKISDESTNEIMEALKFLLTEKG